MRNLNNYNQENHKISQSFCILIVLSQLLPAVVPFHYDIMLVLLYSLIMSKNRENHIFIKYSAIFFFLFLVTILISYIKYIEYTNWTVPKLISDYRMFLVFIFASLIAKRMPITSFINIFVTLPLIVNLLINVLSSEAGLYPAISELWHMPYRVAGYENVFGTATTVAYAAALQGRYSGIFLQPIASGLFHAYCLFTLIWLYKLKLIKELKLVVLVLMCFYNGYSSGSTVFYFSFLLFVNEIILRRRGFILGIVLIALISFFSFVMLFYSDEFNIFLNVIVTSGRFSEESNLMNMLSGISINMYDVIFGFNPSLLGYEGKGAGDSGYVIKIVNGGIFYAILYYIIILMFVLSIIKRSISLENTNGYSIFLSTIIFLLMVEVGSTGFSLPQVSIFVYLYLYFLLMACGRRKI